MRFHQGIYTLILLLLFTLACSPSAKKEQKSSTEAESLKTPTQAVNMGLYFQSALEGDINIVRDALDSGIDPNTRDENSRSALMLSAYNGHEDIVRLLIEKKADVNLVDVANRTALMFAASGPFNATVTTLLDAGANINTVDKEEHWSALMFAASEGQMEVVQTLIGKGADLNLKDIDGESAYDFAKANGHTLVAEFIKSNM